MGINIGALHRAADHRPGSALQYGWRAGFLAAGIGMLLGVAQFLVTRHHLGGAGRTAASPPPARTPPAPGHGCGSARRSTVALVALPLRRRRRRSSPVRAAERRHLRHRRHGCAVLPLPAVLRRTRRRSSAERVLVLVVLFLACALFWAGFEQAGSSLNLFAERNTDRMLGSFEVSGRVVPVAERGVHRGCSRRCSPRCGSGSRRATSIRRRRPSSRIGLIGMAAGFLVMVGAARVVAGGEQAAAYWLVLTYLLHTYGELCLSPVGLSSVTKLVPQRFVGQSMGVWFLATVARQPGRRRYRRRVRLGQCRRDARPVPADLLVRRDLSHRAARWSARWSRKWMGGVK